MPGELCPMVADHIDIVPRADWAAFAAKIGGGEGMEPFVKVVLDQDGAGSCATESTTGGVMVGRQFAGLPFVLLNPWFIYHMTSGGRDQGSSIDENLAFVRENGIAPESVWPRSKGWRATPSDEAKEAALDYRIEEFYDVSTIDEMVSCLLQGFPVVYGSNGHSVLKLRHLDENQGEDLNSWAETWGRKGFGVWATYRAVNWAYGAFAIRTVRQV
jgi:hypothetical protein